MKTSKTAGYILALSYESKVTGLSAFARKLIRFKIYSAKNSIACLNVKLIAKLRGLPLTAIAFTYDLIKRLKGIWWMPWR